MSDQPTLTRANLRAPRAGAIAGIVFSLLFVTSLVLTRVYVPVNPADSGRWLSASAQSVRVALNLLPFAGIAFLWFIGVLRDRLGAREDRFFSTVFFGSGLLFVGLLFVAAAVASGIITLYRLMPDTLMRSGLYTYGRTVAYQLINVYAMKMAGAFMISTCTISVHTTLFPRWIALVGYALAVTLLLGSTFFFWAPLLFPFWVLLVSVHILLANLRDDDAARGGADESVRRQAQ